jgi:hypothetical protein
MLIWGAEVLHMPQVQIQSHAEHGAKSTFIDGTARSAIVGASAGAMLGAALAGEVAAGMFFPIAGAFILAGVNVAAYQMSKKRVQTATIEQIGR